MTTGVMPAALINNTRASGVHTPILTASEHPRAQPGGWLAPLLRGEAQLR
jgi:hypothetical protein